MDDSAERRKRTSCAPNRIRKNPAKRWEAKGGALKAAVAHCNKHARKGEKLKRKEHLDARPCNWAGDTE